LFRTDNLCIIVYAAFRLLGNQRITAFTKLVHALIAPQGLPLLYLFFPSLLYAIIFFHGRRRKKEVGNPGSLNLERTINDALGARTCIRSFYDSRLEDLVRGNRRGAIYPR